MPSYLQIILSLQSGLQTTLNSNDENKQQNDYEECISSLSSVNIILLFIMQQLSISQTFQGVLFIFLNGNEYEEQVRKSLSIGPKNE